MKKYSLICFAILLISNLFSVYHKVGGITFYSGEQDTEIQDNIAVVSTHSQEIQFFDLSCVSNPEMISSISLNDIPREIEVYNNFCYTVVRDTSIVIIDFSDVQNPIYVNEFSFCSDDIVEFEVHEDIIYIFSLCDIIIVSVQDPMNPVLHCKSDINGPYYQTYGIQYENDRIYFSTRAGVMIFDVSDSDNPFYADCLGDDTFYDFQVIDNVAYLANEDGFLVIDVEDYNNIQVLCENTDYEFYSVFVDDETLYSIASKNGTSELYRFDIHDLNNFQPVGSYSGGRVLKVDNDIVFTRTDGWQRADFEILDFSDPVNPYFVGEEYYRCDKKNIYVNDDLLGVCSRGDNDGVNFFDISDPSNPTWLWAQTLGQQSELRASTVVIGDDYAIAGFSEGLLDNTCIRLYDVCNPQDIQILSGLELGDYMISSISVKENIAYVGCYGGLFSIDIYDLTNPTITNFLNNISVRELTVYNDFLFVCTGSSVQIYFIIDPNNPILCGSWESSNYTEAITIYENCAYVSDNHGGLKILDISNPSDPCLVNTLLPHYDSFIYAKPLIHNNKLIISDAYWNELLIYDLSNPAFPELFYSFKWNRLSAELTASEDYLITANDDFGFTILDMDNLTPIVENLIPQREIFLTNYPNPFNPETKITFSLLEDGIVQLDIYNIKGQKVKNLSPSLCHPAVAGRGEIQYSVVWDGTDQNNDPVSSGIYMYQLKVNGKTEAVKKCLLLK